MEPSKRQNKDTNTHTQEAFNKSQYIIRSPWQI